MLERNYVPGLPGSPRPSGKADMDSAIRKRVQILARQFRPSHAAQYHLMRLQAEAYETEAAALAVLLQVARTS